MEKGENTTNADGFEVDGVAPPHKEIISDDEMHDDCLDEDGLCDSSSSESPSADDLGGPKATTIAPKPTIVAHIGLRSYDQSPSSIAKCWVCNASILKGVWRFDYRIRASTKLGDQRRTHSACVGALPSSSKEQDIDAFRSWAAKEGVSSDALAMLKSALAARISAGAASSSGL